MASVKNLKKDVDFLTSELVANSVFRLHLDDSTDRKEIDALISKAINTNSELKSKINKLKKSKDAKVIKEGFKAIATEFMTSIDAGFETIGKLGAK